MVKTKTEYQNLCEILVKIVVTDSSLRLGHSSEGKFFLEYPDARMETQFIDIYTEEKKVEFYRNPTMGSTKKPCRDLANFLSALDYRVLEYCTFLQEEPSDSNEFNYME